ncbi:hypothetical protein T06_5620 [Trichinella sp. T6]|nr:hypothetical protein T06_5620 [Trichinella sp. T6]
MDCEYHGICCERQIQEACCEQGSFEPIVGRTRGVVLRVSRRPLDQRADLPHGKDLP